MSYIYCYGVRISQSVCPLSCIVHVFHHSKFFFFFLSFVIMLDRLISFIFLLPVSLGSFGEGMIAETEARAGGSTATGSTC